MYKRWDQVQQQEALQEKQSSYPTDFLRDIGQLQMASSKNNSIPWEVIKSDGSLTTDVKEVLTQWKKDVF